MTANQERFSYSMTISMHVFLKINPFYMVLKNCCTIATFVLLGYIFPISCISLIWCVTGSRVSGKHSLDPDGITGPLGATDVERVNMICMTGHQG